MSALSVQVRDLTTQLAARNEELETARAELAAAVETAGTIEGLETAHAEALEALNGTHAEALEALTAELAEVREQAETASAELEAVRTELTQAQDQLADPAFADASAEGQEPEAVASDEDLPTFEALGSLKGAERVAYWRKNKTQLIK